MRPTAWPADTRSKSTIDSSRCSGVARRELTHPVYFEHQIALVVHVERGSEARAPLDLVVAVGISGVHRLAERVVISLHQNEHLGLQLFQVRGRLPIQRALRIDGMHDGPRQREKVDGRPLELENG